MIVDPMFYFKNRQMYLAKNKMAKTELNIQEIAQNSLGTTNIYFSYETYENKSFAIIQTDKGKNTNVTILHQTGDNSCTCRYFFGKNKKKICKHLYMHFLYIQLTN